VRWNGVLAAIALEQLSMLPAWVEQRRRVGDRLLDIIGDYPLRPHPTPAGAAPSYWWFAFHLDPARCDYPPAAFAAAMTAEGVPCRVGPQPNVLQWELFRKLNRNPQAFRHYRPGPALKPGAFDPRRFPETAHSRRTVLAITVDQHVTIEDTEDVRRVFDKLFEE
jgi:dTDP-4-amino-4,6-dideoxygalactose transaminase